MAETTSAVETMDMEMARKITGECVLIQAQAAGVPCDRPDLDFLRDRSLMELLQANQMVGSAGSEGGRYWVHCDDRLVAAIYVALHYPPDDPASCEPVIHTDRAAVIVVTTPKPQHRGVAR